ncbi:MAG: tRNA (adenosine(37)-N6)-dimethylallyltransferase MiaA [Clostridia bacterium]|nr:tRNA (adenosine(37)-N6)-dimethylallyltransferase MiaA [Clostridia bacterium]
MKGKVIAVVGPTAVGKTALSVALAKEFGGQIISCDSMQVYRGMDIGTAKVTVDEAQGVPHHMIDVVSPCDNFSCAVYADMAKAKTDELLSGGVLPIFCGGTGQYLAAGLTDNTFSAAGIDEGLRARLNEREKEDLWDELSLIDPEAAAATHMNNKKRVVRALETYYLTGVTKTEWDARSRLGERPYDALVIGLTVSDRESLYRRIERRVDLMMEKGLEAEVRSLCIPHGTTAAEGIGYKEMIAYIEGRCSLCEAVEEIKRNSKRYAKRQLTWFRGKDYVRFIDVDAEDVTGTARRMCEEFLKG